MRVRVAVIFWTLRCTACALRLTVPSKFTVEIITVGFIHPTSTSSLAYNGPAFETAIRDMGIAYKGSFELTHVVLYDQKVKNCWEMGDSCDAMVGRYFYGRRSHTNMTALIIPGCADAVFLNKLAAQWDLLLITGVVADPVLRNKHLSPTWITTTPVQVPSFVSLIVSVLRKYKWTTVYVVTDNAANPFYVGFAGSLVSTLSKLAGCQATTWVTNSTLSTDYHAVLDDFRKRSRVCLFFGHAFYLRLFLAQAAAKDMTNGDYVYLGLDTFHNINFGGFLWRDLRSSTEKPSLLMAIRSLMVVGLGQSVAKIKSNRAGLESEWMALSRERYNFTYPKREKPTPYVTGCYAAVEVFAHVLNETLHTDRHFDPNDGKTFARKFFNRTFTTSVTDVHLDEVGDRRVNLVLQTFIHDAHDGADGNDTLTLQTVAVHFGDNQSLVEVLPIQWANGVGPPANEPPCGYSDQKYCDQRADGSPTKLIGITVGCSLLCVLLVLAGLVILAVRRDVGFFHMHDDRTWWQLDRKALTQEIAPQLTSSKENFSSSTLTNAARSVCIFVANCNGLEITTP